jgi:chlorite dismutase
VTLLADDPKAIKDVVHDMRFDEASARYALFGPFTVGIRGELRESVALAGLRPL